MTFGTPGEFELKFQGSGDNCSEVATGNFEPISHHKEKDRYRFIVQLGPGLS